VAFSPDGTLLATSSADGATRIMMPARAVHAEVHGRHDASVLGVAFSADGKLLASASADGTTRIWDVRTLDPLATLIALPGGGFATLLPDGGYKVRDPGDDIWWAIKLCRFAPGELDPYVPGLRQLPTTPRFRCHG
jgi:WD40 repeat protein